MDELIALHGTRVLLCAVDGPPLGSEADAGDILGAAWGQDATLVAVPVARLGPGFLRLSTRVAGAIAQKFVNYRMQLVILGDIGAALAGSGALRDFVRESNAGRSLWFLADLAALERKLAPPHQSGMM
ncbi:MAG TPA: DUF4180 domain-containing protein [Roseomonas sp.]|jgi:hypothetical protein